MATVAENLKQLQRFSTAYETPRMRHISTMSYVSRATKRELEQLVVVMVEGHMHGADAARTMTEEAGW